MRDDSSVAIAIEAELKQRLTGARQEGLRVGQLNLPASGTKKGKQYRQILRRLCTEKQIANLGTVSYTHLTLPTIYSV